MGVDEYMEVLLNIKQAAAILSTKQVPQHHK
jgi:hypothetical protein